MRKKRLAMIEKRSGFTGRIASPLKVVDAIGIPRCASGLQKEV
jgi:hypothetical protein